MFETKISKNTKIVKKLQNQEGLTRICLEIFRKFC